MAAKPFGQDPARRVFAGDRPFLSRAKRRALLLTAYNIPLVLDIGAWHGTYGQALRDAGYRGRIASFEPSKTSFADLELAAADDDSWATYRMALGDSSGSVRLNVAEDSRCNSVLAVGERSILAAPESAFVGAEEVPLRRLDELWSKVVGPGVSPYLKIDVQGFELAVLRGALPYLASVAMVEVELSLVPLYDGGPLWTQVLAFLHSLSFRLVSVETVFEDITTGEMLQVDGIFARGARVSPAHAHTALAPPTGGHLV